MPRIDGFDPKVNAEQMLDDLDGNMILLVCRFYIPHDALEDLAVLEHAKFGFVSPQLLEFGSMTGIRIFCVRSMIDLSKSLIRIIHKPYEEDVRIRWEGLG